MRVAHGRTNHPTSRERSDPRSACASNTAGFVAIKASVQKRMLCDFDTRPPHERAHARTLRNRSSPGWVLDRCGGQGWSAVRPRLSDVIECTPVIARRLLVLVVLLASTSSLASSLRINLEVDATDVLHGIQHVRLVLPAHAGPMTLAYPEWIPGEHRPTGPITQLANLHIEAGGQDLPWRRDARDAFLLHLTVPSQTRAIAVRFDFFSPPRSFGPGFGETPDATTHLLVLAFNQLILYPADASADAVEVSTRVHIPAGWKVDSALPLEQVSGNEVSLPVASLYTLVDSPLLAGEYFRTIPLEGGSAPARMSIAADRPGDLAVSDSMIGSLDRLLSEATALFGPGHYRRYVWLVALGDRLGHDGLEHHESSDVREAEGLFTDPAYAIVWRLFPHEYVHSWNGKYRRPDGLATRNYQQPMIDDLLWVYEGLTRYYGDFVLSARSGFASEEQTRTYLAYVAALIARARPGRDWRSIADTAAADPAYAQAPAEWESVRRGSDFYSEMLLVWLEADTLIRKQTHGRRSLDDFCRGFFAGPERAPAVRPYSRADLIGALQRTAAFDWDASLDREWRASARELRSPGSRPAAGSSTTTTRRTNSSRRLRRPTRRMT